MGPKLIIFFPPPSSLRVGVFTASNTAFNSLLSKHRKGSRILVLPLDTSLPGPEFLPNSASDFDSHIKSNPSLQMFSIMAMKIFPSHPRRVSIDLQSFAVDPWLLTITSQVIVSAREYLSVHFWKVVSVNNSVDVYAHTQEHTHVGRGRKQRVSVVTVQAGVKSVRSDG